MVQYGGRTVLIDTTPDFRQQALRESIDRIDAILFTHSHADHIMGLDDVRPLNLRQKSTIPIYGSSETLTTIQASFRYIFESSNPESSIPKLAPHPLTMEGVDLFGLQFTPSSAQPRPVLRLRISVWGCGIPDGPQQNSRCFHREVGGPGCVVSGRASSQATSDPHYRHPSFGICTADRAETGLLSRISVTICPTKKRSATSLPTYGLPTTVCES